MVGHLVAVLAAWLVASMAACGTYIFVAGRLGRGPNTFPLSALLSLLVAAWVWSMVIIAVW